MKTIFAKGWRAFVPESNHGFSPRFRDSVVEVSLSSSEIAVEYTLQNK
jgi:hypothetical protein